MKIWLLVSKEETKRRFGRSMYHSFSFLHNQIMWLSFQPYVIWLRPLQIFPQCCLSPSQLHISSLLSGNAMRFRLHNALILAWVNGILSNLFPPCFFSRNWSEFVCNHGEQWPLQCNKGMKRWKKDDFIRSRQNPILQLGQKHLIVILSSFRTAVMHRLIREGMEDATSMATALANYSFSAYLIALFRERKTVGVGYWKKITIHFLPLRFHLPRQIVYTFLRWMLKRPKSYSL